MARDLHKTVMDGDRYEMRMLGATAGYRLFHRLFKMLGPSIGSLIDAASSGDIQSVDLSSSSMSAGIQALTENVSESDLDHVIDVLKGQTGVAISGSENVAPLKGVFEAHFQGRPGTMFKWIWWGLQVQFADFSDAFANLKPQGGGETSQAEQSP